MFKDIALVLEGGGMRGAYTAGVLDAFHDEGFKFGGYAGTSAGATHLCNYLSEQRERNLRLDTIHSKDPRYMSLGNWLRTGNYFDLEFCYHTVPEVIDPFDYETFRKSAEVSEFYVAASNVETGGAEHFRVRDLKADLEAIRASSSLALVSSLVHYQGKKMFDGNTADSIPFEFMDSIGYRKQVVITTRPLGYQKTANTLLPLYKLVYRKYPNFVKSIGNRHIRYNKCLKTLAQWEKEGKVFVFRPSVNMKISRVEKDTAKLQALYALGLKDARDHMDALKKFLGV
ncbi:MULTISPECIES: patatin family protein [unclassified Fibrobacter]|uniref:patatin-like phospholipase family protein n=1 Tax=unclassified Fibrobacter TaxID=2634177 RepID=UPI000D6AC44D|nr:MULTISPECIES: patatin family protein [unclassified Fibrobacter]